MSELEHFNRDIYELDARIAQLALICGANLSRSAVVVGLIKGEFDVCEHKNNLGESKLVELRGLLMLKYKVEAECVDDFGVEHLEHLLSEQDKQLRSRGFPPESLADIK